MRPEEISVCIIRAPGTNCDRETVRCFAELGTRVTVVHTGKLQSRNFESSDIIVIPGGFSYGDYVRAGALWAKRLVARFGGEISKYIGSGKLMLGICNGFQVMVEAGLLPWTDVGQEPQASLAVNVSGKFECRWVKLSHSNTGRCAFTQKLSLGEIVCLPVAHSEGRFVFAEDKGRINFRRLVENGQLVFTYARDDGSPAMGKYPFNPNGSYEDIAGVCNEEGTALGLMPHPERAFYAWQMPSWGKTKAAHSIGCGRFLFESAVEYICRKF